MKIIIDKTKKKIADELQDPTSMKTIIRYMSLNAEGIEYVMIVQKDYNLSEVVSPLMVNFDKSEEPKSINGMSHEEYMIELFENEIIRMIVPEGHKRFIIEPLSKFIDEPSDYDNQEAVTCVMLPPLYWVKLMGKRWE